MYYTIGVSLIPTLRVYGHTDIPTLVIIYIFMLSYACAIPQISIGNILTSLLTYTTSKCTMLANCGMQRYAEVIVHMYIVHSIRGPQVSHIQFSYSGSWDIRILEQLT